MYDFERCLKISAMRIGVMPFHINYMLRIIYVLDGEIELTWVAGKQHLRRGELEIINVQEPVSIRSISMDNTVLFYEFDMEFAKRYASEIDAITYNCNGTNFFQSKAKLKNQFHLKEKLLHLYETYTTPNQQYKLPSEVMSIMLLIDDQFNDVKNLLEANSNSELQIQRFLRINRYLIDHMNSKILLSDVAQKEYLSPHYISKEFTRLFGKNFQAMLDYYRMKVALRLLISTEDPISVVAEKCGFSAVRYFNEKFKGFMGFTASAFRKEIRDRIPYGEVYQLNSPKVYQNVEETGMALIGDRDKGQHIDLSGGRDSFEAGCIVDENIRYILRQFPQVEDIQKRKLFKLAPKIIESIPFSKPDIFAKEMFSNPNFKEWWRESLNDCDSAMQNEALVRIVLLIRRLRGTILQTSEDYIVVKNESGQLLVMISNIDKTDKHYVLCFDREEHFDIILIERLRRLKSKVRKFLEICPETDFQSLILPVAECEEVQEGTCSIDVKAEGESVTLFILNSPL